MKNRTSAPVWLMATLVATSAATGAGAGCAKDLDTSRESVDKGSFGETLVTLVCKRIAYIEELEAVENGEDPDGRVDVSGERYRASCRGLEQPPADAPPEIHAITAHRDRLIAAIDAMWPEAMLDDVQEFATSDEFLAAYDDGTIENAMIALRDMLQELEPRTDMLQVFERLSLREGYTPGTSGTLASILSSPDLANVLRYTSEDIAPGGSAHDALVLLAEAAALELQDLEAPANPQDPESTQNLLLNLLLDQHSSLSTQTSLLLAARDHRGIAEIAPLATGVLPAPFIDADGDGLADVDDLGRYVDATGAVIDAPTPLPTADPDPEGTVRDELGRAIETGASQLPLYRYLYPDDTLLVALARDASALLHPDRGTGIDLVRGAGALLGPRVTTTRDYDGRQLEYSGFDTTQSPILDALYGGLQVLRTANAGDVLELGRVMITDHEPTAAELAEALLDALDVPGELGEIGDRAKLEADSRLVDDLVPVIQQILDEPGLLEDVLEATKDPRVIELGGYFRDYMRYADKLGYAPKQPLPPPDDPIEYEVVSLDTGMPVTSLTAQVDRNMPDTGFNRSIFQRVLHLLADVNGMSLCNRPDARVTIELPGFSGVAGPFAECELLEIENLAVFYVQSLAYLRNAQGNFLINLQDLNPNDPNDVPDDVCDNSLSGTNTGEFVRAARLPFQWPSEILEDAADDNGLPAIVKIRGLGNCPTPQALNRLLFIDPTPNAVQELIVPPADRFGEPLVQKHAGSVVAWELGEFYDLVQPLAQPFVDHGKEQVFLDLLIALHNHWPSRGSESYQQEDPAGANYAFASNLVSFEPIVVEVLDRGLLMPALVEGAGVLDALTVNGKSAVQVLRETGQFVLEPLPGLTTRTGANSVTRPDGTQVAELAPWHVLAQGIGGLFDAIDAGGERVEAFEDGLSEAVDLFARAAPDGEGDYHFTNPRLRGVGLIALDFLDARLAAHPAGPDRDAWLSQELPADAEELLASPLVAGASDMVDALAADPMARTAVEGLLAYALDETRDPEAFATMVTATIDLLQLVLRAQGELVPVAHGIGAVLDPDRGWLDPLLILAATTGQVDDRNVLAQTLRNLVTEHEPGHTPIGDIIDGIAAVQRVAPQEDLDERYTAADYAAMLSGIAKFVDDEKRGLRKFIRILQGRNQSE
jgi:hypothetical protein